MIESRARSKAKESKQNKTKAVRRHETPKHFFRARIVPFGIQTINQQTDHQRLNPSLLRFPRHRRRRAHWPCRGERLDAQHEHHDAEAELEGLLGYLFVGLVGRLMGWLGGGGMGPLGLSLPFFKSAHIMIVCGEG